MENNVMNCVQQPVSYRPPMYRLPQIQQYNKNWAHEYLDESLMYYCFSILFYSTYYHYYFYNFFKNGV